jgi:hypothetical protein
MKFVVFAARRVEFPRFHFADNEPARDIVKVLMMMGQ